MQWRRPIPQRLPSDDDEYGIFHSLSHGNPDTVVQALANAREDHDYLRSLPPTLWSSILRSLDPEEWGIPIHRVHRSMSATAVKNTVRQTYDFARLFSNVVAIRRDAGLRLELPDYRILLSHAARIGNRRMAQDLWSDMRRDRVKPDLQSFKSLLDATMFDEEMRLAQGKGASYNIPWHDEVPRATPIRKFLHAHSEEMMQIFRTLTEGEKLIPDTHVLCSLMTSLAHDGHIEATSELLQQYWGINVSALTNGREISVRQLPASHPLYPKPKLLSTVADAYGLHNRLPVAYGLVDTISKQYDIPIMHNTWFSLLEWTFLHSMHEAREEKRRQFANPLQLSRLPQVMQAMVNADSDSQKSERQPSIDMLHLYFKNLFPQRVRFKPEFLEPLYAGRALTLRRVDQARQLRNSVVEARSFIPGQVNLQTALNSVQQLQHKSERAEVEKRRHLGLLSRWVKNVLSSGIPDSTPLAPERAAELNEWYLRGLPNFMLEWIGLLPTKFVYQLKSVVVELHVRRPEENQRISTEMDEWSSRRGKTVWLDLSKVEKPWIQQKSPAMETRYEHRKDGQGETRDGDRVVNHGWRGARRMGAGEAGNPLAHTNRKSGALRKGAFELMETPTLERVEDCLDRQVCDGKSRGIRSSESSRIYEDDDIVQIL
ncbi:MAG: hypothetical protein M1831_004296 [Alyxoria varia]|nr:MAG: hypothetical protein M1831_004296 [Alyxoria varia]